MGKADATLAGSMLTVLRSPVVYVFRRGAEVLYVGKGASAARPLDRKHHALHDLTEQPEDQLELYGCKDDHAALVLEAQLIRSLAPLRNRDVSGREPTTPKAERQRRDGLERAKTLLWEVEGLRKRFGLSREELAIPDGLVTVRAVEVEKITVERVFERVPYRVLRMPPPEYVFAEALPVRKPRSDSLVLTGKQRVFARALAKGMSKREAAKLAGSTQPDLMGQKWIKLAKVQAYLEQLRAEADELTAKVIAKKDAATVRDMTRARVLLWEMAEGERPAEFMTGADDVVKVKRFKPHAALATLVELDKPQDRVVNVQVNQLPPDFVMTAYRKLVNGANGHGNGNGHHPPEEAP